MPYTDDGKNTMLDALGIDDVALFDGDPDSGGSELAGGSPAYARVSITWNSASGGNLDSSSQPQLNVPSGDTPAYVVFYAGATRMAQKATGESAYASQGTYTITDADLDLNG